MATAAKTARAALKKYIPLFDRIMVLRAEPLSKSKGGVFMPKPKRKNSKAVVVAAGPGYRTQDGRHLPCILKVGDIVLLPEFNGASVEIDGVEYEVYKENTLLGKIEF